MYLRVEILNTNSLKLILKNFEENKPFRKVSSAIEIILCGIMQIPKNLFLKKI